MMASAKCVLAQTVRDRAQQLIDARGVCMAAKLLGIQPVTLKSAVGGLTIQPGTAVLLEIKLRERDTAGRVP